MAAKKKADGSMRKRSGFNCEDLPYEASIAAYEGVSRLSRVLRENL